MAQTKPGLERLIELQSFILKFRSVKRMIYQPDGNKRVKENDVEHSYALAMVGWYLTEYFPELDADKVIRFALIHDLVEVYAGDTYIFGNPGHLATKHKREADAARKIAEEWPDFSSMNADIDEYEKMKLPEAKFIYALDKVMPILLNLLTDGFTWKKGNISLEQLHSNKLEKIAVSAEIKPYYDLIYDFLISNQHLFTKT